jgi:hypothetical protein
VMVVVPEPHAADLEAPESSTQLVIRIEDKTRSFMVALFLFRSLTLLVIRPRVRG